MDNSLSHRHRSALHLYTDASTDGISYFLLQENEITDEDGKKIVDDEGKQKIIKTIVHMAGSTAPWNLSCSVFNGPARNLIFLLGAPEMNLNIDPSGVCGVLKKHISEITKPRLERMCEKLLPYLLFPAQRNNSQ